ncbi:MAG: hypothetical protein ABSB78_12460 [Bacteroidota bacterium]
MISRWNFFPIVISGALIIILYTCKDMGSEPPAHGSQFSADSISLHIAKGSSRQVTLSGGKQPYSIKLQPNTAIATASLSSTLLTISAVDTGNTYLVLNDSSTPAPDTVKISISVFAASPLPTVHYSTQVQPIFNGYCTSCHGSYGGLSLAPGSSYTNLVNVKAQSSCTSLKRVLPNDANNSVLYRKVAGSTCSSRMPQGGSLSASEITLIETWINEGALNN